MATLEELVVRLTAETSGLRAELANATKVTEKSMGDMTAAIDKFSEDSSKSTGFFEQSLATMVGFLGSQAVLGAVNAVTESFGFFKEQLLEGVKAAEAEEQALTRLSTALALSGNYSAQAKNDLSRFSGEMEELTGVQDDVVLSNLAVLASLTRLGSEGLKSAEKAALDMSVALGMDLNTATLLVAKGINGNTEAFKRYGITIQEGASKAENFKNVTSALNDNFGGAAANAMKTFQGSMLGVTNAFGNLFEAIATAVTKNPVFIAQLQEIAKIVTETTGAVTSANNVLQQMTGYVSLLATEGFRDLLLVVEGAVDVVNSFVIGLNAIQTAIWAVIEGAAKLSSALTGVGDVNFDKTKAAFDQMSENILNMQGHSIGLIDDLDRVADAGAAGFIKIGQEVDNTTNKINNQTEVVKSAYATQLETFATGLAEKNLLLSDQYAAEQEMLVANLEAGNITREEYNTAYNESVAAQHEAELAELDAYYADKKGKDQEYANARQQLQDKQTLQDLKNKKSQTDAEKSYDKQRMANFDSTMGTIATLSQSSNKELQAIGKAAAITQATIDGYAAVQKALASAPPPYNFALAALVGTATALNISKIAGVGIGLNKGGEIKNMGQGNRDTMPAMLTGGENVVDRSTNNDLKDFLAQQKQGQPQQLNITISFAGATVIGDVRSGEFGAAVVEAINEATRRGQTVGLLPA